MDFHVMTLFPDMIMDGLNTSITGRAIKAGVMSVKAYDIRGVVPSELNVELAYNIARGYKKFSGCKSVVIGRDIRKSSKPSRT